MRPDGIPPQGNTETSNLLTTALQRPAHRPESAGVSVDNINTSTRPDGTTQAAALRKLRKDAPKLHEQVIAGRLSAHAAIVEAERVRATKATAT